MFPAAQELIKVQGTVLICIVFLDDLSGHRTELFVTAVHNVKALKQELNLVQSQDTCRQQPTTDHVHDNGHVPTVES